MPNPILMRRMGGRARGPDLCAVNELFVSEEVFAGGGDCFNCYPETEEFKGTSTGSGFTGVWVTGNSPFGYAYGDDFEAYAVSNDEPATGSLDAGIGPSEGPWILSERDPAEWTVTSDWPIWWLEADKIVGLAEGHSIQIWQDYAAIDNLVQDTVARRPTFRTNVINGLPVARFAATNWMGAGQQEKVRNRAASSWVSVFNWSTVTDLGAHRFLLTIIVGAWAARVAIGAFSAPLGAGHFGLGIGGRRLDGDSFQLVERATALSTGWCVLVGVFNYQAATLELWFNGTKEVSRVFQTSGNTSDTNSTSIVLGSAETNASFVGDLAAFQFFPRVLADAEVTAITNYFRSKYGF